MKALYLTYAAIFWFGSCVQRADLTLNTHTGRKLLELGGQLIDASFTIYIFTDKTACSGFIFKHGFAITSSTCAAKGDHITVCRLPNTATKKCKDGTELAVKKVVTDGDATVLVLSDTSIRGLEIEYTVPPAGTKCQAIGFAGGVTELSVKPSGFETAVSGSDATTITLAAAEGKDVCFADIGGPVVCYGKGVGLFINSHKECVGNKPNTAITLRKVQKLIDRTVLGDKTDKPGNAPHICFSHIMIIFPISIVILMVI